LGEVAALQPLDGKHHFPEAALWRFSPTATSGQKPTFNQKWNWAGLSEYFTAALWCILSFQMHPA